MPAAFRVLILTVLVATSLAAQTASPQPAVPQDWSTSTPEASGLSAPTLAQMEAAIRNGDFKHITSVLIARNGKLAYERYFEGATEATLHNTRSCTKTITSASVGIAIDRKLLPGVSAPIWPYFADKMPVQNPDPRKEKITVEDLLTMSSILECDDLNSFSRGNEERMYIMEDWTKFVLDLPVRGYAPWVTRPDKAKYGRTFSYCTGGVFLLGRVLDKAAHEKVEKFTDDTLFTPLGITQRHWAVSTFNEAMTGGGLEMRSRDLLKFAQMYLNGGKWHGQQVVPADWVKQSMAPHVQADDEQEYGYLWWLKNYQAAGKAFSSAYMGGSGGNHVHLFPAQDMVVIITTTNFRERDPHGITDRLLTTYVLPAVQ